MLLGAGFGILRADGRWYAGTADHEAFWGKVAAVFPTEDAAATRASSLKGALEIIPVVP